MLRPADRAATFPWFALVVFAAAWLAHGGSLQGGWVLDDVVVVRDSPAVVAGLPDVLASDAWGGSVEPAAWRPLTLSSFALEAPLWRDGEGQLAPFGFHLTNVLLHALTSVLVFAVGLAALPRRPRVGAAAALLFAVHPLFAGAVAPLLGRADVLAGLLGGIAAWLWVRAMRRSPALLPLAVLAFFLALLAKESVVGLPILLLGLAALVRAPRRRMAAGGALLLLVLVVWQVLRPAPLPAPGAALAEGCAGLARSALGLLLPVGIVSDRLAVDLPPGALGVGLGLALLLVSLALWAGRGRDPTRVSGWVATFALLVLAAALVAPPGAALEGRFAYALSLPAFAVLGLGLERLVAAARPGLRRATAAALTAALVVALALLTHLEGAAWSDESAYYASLVRTAPQRPEIRLRYARLRLGEAEAVRDALVRRPATDETAAVLRGDLAFYLSEAAITLEALTHVYPGRPAPWRELGRLRVLQGRAAEGEAALRRALALDPWLQAAGAPREVPADHRVALAHAYYQLGLALEAQARVEVALEHFKLAVRLAPRDEKLVSRAGRACIRAGRDHEGLLLLRRAMDLAGDPATREHLEAEFKAAREAALLRADRSIDAARRAENEAEYREALAAYEDALLADPSRLEAYLRLAWLRGEYFGDFRRARAVLDEARAMLEEAGGDVDALKRVDDARAILDEQERQAEAEETADDAD